MSRGELFDVRAPGRPVASVKPGCRDVTAFTPRVTSRQTRRVCGIEATRLEQRVDVTQKTSLCPPFATMAKVTAFFECRHTQPISGGRMRGGPRPPRSCWVESGFWGRPVNGSASAENVGASIRPLALSPESARCDKPSAARPARRKRAGHSPLVPWTRGRGRPGPARRKATGSCHRLRDWCPLRR